MTNLCRNFPDKYVNSLAVMISTPHTYSVQSHVKFGSVRAVPNNANIPLQ